MQVIVPVIDSYASAPSVFGSCASFVRRSIPGIDRRFIISKENVRRCYAGRRVTGDSLVASTAGVRNRGCSFVRTVLQNLYDLTEPSRASRPRRQAPLSPLLFGSFSELSFAIRATCSRTETILSGARERQRDKINMSALLLSSLSLSLFCSARFIISLSSFLAEFASRRHRLNLPKFGYRLAARWGSMRDRY